MKWILYAYFCVVCVKACEEHTTCGACIRDASACVWCSTEESFNGPRCISENNISQNWCLGHINNPKSVKVEYDEVNPNSENIVQIKPHRIKMKLRPGQPMNFDFFFNATEHYPVDLYFLYQASMIKDQWNGMVEMIEEVYDYLRSMTKNVSIGFGTFIDKNMPPFMTINNSTLAYSFKHHLTLSSDYAELKNKTDGVRIDKSEYNDNPEGGFDALAQVLACDKIGWSNTSRKIVVFSTHNVYHAHGDGEAAGIINPYDAKCYLENGEYTKEKEMDYPSLSVINKLASDRDVTIIFVISLVKSTYGNLEEVINGAHVVYPMMMDDGSSIASELKDTYENIIRKIKLNYNIKPEQHEDKIKLLFNPDCLNECDVKQNTEVKFTGTITVSEYFEAEDIEVVISVQGIKEKLTLDIQVINDCNCTTEDNALCNGKGKRRCGVCECERQWSGPTCECSTTNQVTKDKSTCMDTNSKSLLECNGRGSCSCGKCLCGSRYVGRFCECDKENCPRDKNGDVCGHGRCLVCSGECECSEGWTRNLQGICKCENSTYSCQTGRNVCFNNGHCECNECKCSPSLCEWDGRSSLDLRCQPVPCVDCHVRQCRLLEPYALANVDRDTPCRRRVDVTSAKELENGTGWMRCSDVWADVGCYTSFVYKYDDEEYGVHLIVQSEYNCAESAYIYGGACLGTILLVGIVTLVGWKVLSVYRDRKEYKRFVEEHRESLKSSQPYQNILYNSPNTTVSNPNYRRPSLW